MLDSANLYHGTYCITVLVCLTSIFLTHISRQTVGRVRPELAKIHLKQRLRIHHELWKQILRILHEYLKQILGITHDLNLYIYIAEHHLKIEPAYPSEMELR